MYSDEYITSLFRHLSTLTPGTESHRVALARLRALVMGK